MGNQALAFNGRFLQHSLGVVVGVVLGFEFPVPDAHTGVFAGFAAIGMHVDYDASSGFWIPGVSDDLGYAVEVGGLKMVAVADEVVTHLDLGYFGDPRPVGPALDGSAVLVGSFGFHGLG